MAVKSSFTNMILCLGTITLVCGALLAGIYILTASPIEQAKKARTQEAIAKVLPPFESLSEAAVDGEFEYSFAMDAQGDTVGVAIKTFSTGFGGRIRMMVGFKTDGTVCSTSILEHSETPGLGAKAEESAFAGQFAGFDPAQKKLLVKQDNGDVDAITAATITSRAYCVAVQNAVDEFRKLMPAAPAEIADTTDVEIVNMEGNINE